MKKLPYKLLDANKLIPYRRNAREHPPGQIKALEKAIVKFGFTVPVLIDGSGEVIAGHGRLIAAKNLKLGKIPVMVADHLTEDECRQYRIADNRLAEMSAWDRPALRDEMRGLLDDIPDMDLGPIGFDRGSLAQLMPAATETEDPPAPEPPKNPVVKPGEIWQLGDHRLGCGDSTDPDFVGRLLDGARPQIMVTDPPYGVQYDAQWRQRFGLGNTQQTGRVLNDNRGNWSDAWRLFPGKVMYIWHPAARTAETDSSIEACGFLVRSQIIWAKRQHPISRANYHWAHEVCYYAVRQGESADWLGGRKQKTVWDDIEAPRKSADSVDPHPTQKPLECMERPIRNHLGDVFEPFAGSGTSIIAADRQARRCHAMEISPEYCDVIIERWQRHSGDAARRAAGA